MAVPSNRTGMPYSKGFKERDAAAHVQRIETHTWLPAGCDRALQFAGIFHSSRRRSADREPATGQLRHGASKARTPGIQPFTLELTLWGLNIGTPGKEQVAFEKLYANLQINSLWTRALHLQRVELIKPRTELLFDKQGKLNLAQLFKLPASEPAKDEPATKPFPLRIDEIKLAGGYVHFGTCAPANPSSFSTTRWISSSRTSALCLKTTPI